jgi:hypothetical protein
LALGALMRWHWSRKVADCGTVHYVAFITDRHHCTPAVYVPELNELCVGPFTFRVRSQAEANMLLKVFQSRTIELDEYDRRVQARR